MHVKMQKHPDQCKGSYTVGVPCILTLGSTHTSMGLSICTDQRWSGVLPVGVNGDRYVPAAAGSMHVHQQSHRGNAQ